MQFLPTPTLQIWTTYRLYHHRTMDQQLPVYKYRQFVLAFPIFFWRSNTSFLPARLPNFALPIAHIHLQQGCCVEFDDSECIQTSGWSGTLRAFGDSYRISFFTYNLLWLHCSDDGIPPYTVFILISTLRIPNFKRFVADYQHAVCDVDFIAKSGFGIQVQNLTCMTALLIGVSESHCWGSCSYRKLAPGWLICLAHRPFPQPGTSWVLRYHCWSFLYHWLAQASSLCLQSMLL